jgi:hypothetical protein
LTFIGAGGTGRSSADQCAGQEGGELAAAEAADPVDIVTTIITVIADEM